MWPSLLRGAAQLSPYALRAMGVGRNAGSLLGSKAQMIQTPDLSELPTSPFSESEMGKAFKRLQDLGGNVSGFLQQKAAAADQGGVDESGFATAYPNPPTQPLSPLPTVAVNSIPQPGAQAPQLSSLPTVPVNSVPQPAPQGMDAYATAPQGATGPSLIQKFMQQLHTTGPGPYAYDRAGASTRLVMNEEQIVHLGAFCERLLGDDDFNTVTQLFEAQTLQITARHQAPRQGSARRTLRDHPVGA
jgi:hypothetical protein